MKNSTVQIDILYTKEPNHGIVFCNERMYIAGKLKTECPEKDKDFISNCLVDNGLSGKPYNINVVKSDKSWRDVAYHVNSWGAFLAITNNNWNKNDELFS